MSGRDRDETGRARNARPRDALGRPLPHGTAGVPPIPDDLDLPPAEAIGYAQRLLDEGRPFAAHEVFEAVWKAAPAQERELWQGLAQVAVGLTHVQRGNLRGAATMLRRGTARLPADPADPAGPAGPPHPAGPPAPYGLDLRGIARTANELADRLDAGDEVTDLPPLRWST